MSRYDRLWAPVRVLAPQLNGSGACYSCARDPWCGMGLFHWWVKEQEPRETDNAEPATRAAATAGSADAQFQLGLHLSVPKSGQDLSEAVGWYEKAAQQGHRLAQFNLAIMLNRGQGVSRNEEASLMWARRAAEGGDPGAQHFLGGHFHRSSLHHLAQDCAESRLEAYKWFRLAADQGYFGSREACDEMTRHMTHEDVADGNRRAAGIQARIGEGG